MNYIYPPLYKYIAFILIFFMFIRYYRVITQDNYLLIAIVATVLIIILDYFLIENHPGFLNTDDNQIDSETEMALNKLIDHDTENSNDTESTFSD